MQKPSRLKKLAGIFCAGLLVAALLALAVISYAAKQVTLSAAGRLYNDPEAIPARDVGLVLGARPGNRFFTRRIEAAASLYHTGKVSWLLVSGDNSQSGYDEPTAMAQALNQLGVPASAIYCDYAGFTTLDSVVRAREIFNQHNITIISQAFHNQRAVYLAQHYGIDAIAFNAEDPALRHTKYTLLRERIARIRALFDAQIWHREPHFYGPKIPIGPDTPQGCNLQPATGGKSVG